MSMSVNGHHLCYFVKLPPLKPKTFRIFALTGTGPVITLRPLIELPKAIANEESYLRILVGEEK